MIRLRYRLTVGMSSTDAEDKDLCNQDTEALIDTLGEGGSIKFTIPATTSDRLVQHPAVASAKFVYLRTSSKDPTQPPAEMTVKRNSTAGEAWPITPVDGKVGHFLLSTSGLTALYVSNPGAVDMEIIAAVAGD